MSSRNSWSVANLLKVSVLTDIHYAGPGEIARGWNEAAIVGNPLLRLFLRAYRHFIWRREPFAHNYLLDRFLSQARDADLVVANGDYSCDTAFVGLCDDASFQSAHECVARLRRVFGSRLHLTIGDHELGKMSLFGRRGGLRLASWRRTVGELGLLPSWRLEAGSNVLIGVTSSLLALPVYLPEVLPEEEAEWRHLSEAHMSEVRDVFSRLRPRQRVLLFCHDPSALPFMWRDPVVRSRLEQISATLIGHLHSPFLLKSSRRLCGMPEVHFLGNAVRRMSSALKEARLWEVFKIRLCPALAGIELLKDGGYFNLELDREGLERPRFVFHPLPWERR
ncbi:MAG: metallophosphoesterase [Verrucomicrobia bacterium]|nr:metallophosphoesterase [Verrucomicrobiota bacterium]